MGGALLSKSLIQFSVDGWGCVPSLLLTWGQTMVEVMKIMVTSFKRTHACTPALSAPSPAAGHHRPTPLLETPGHSQASLGQSLVGSLFLSLLKEVTIIFITTTIVWPQVISRERAQLHPSTENWIKDLLSLALPIRTRSNFPLSQSLPSRSSHKPLILFHQRANRLKTTITEN